MTDQTAYVVNSDLEVIPFVDVLLPYTACFLARIPGEVSARLADKLHVNLLKGMSFIAEVALQEALDQFVNSGRRSYQEFVVLTHTSLADKYPVLDKVLKTTVSNYSQHIQNIYANLRKDWPQLSTVFSLSADGHSGIKDIDTSLGDGHHGESTALITLTDGTRLIYKPRNVDIALAYNSFIHWVNHKLDADLKTITCVSGKDYGWLEFVPNDAVNSSEELAVYYYQAGILLAVTLVLGSKDCHYENVIASGKHPVIIDYETIIQPVLSQQSVRTWDETHKIPYCSLLESMLIVNSSCGVPLEHAGYGVKGKIKSMGLSAQVIHPNSIDSKRSTRFLSQKWVKENVPMLRGQYVFANHYQQDLISGFSAAYDMFLRSREELLAEGSPIFAFANQRVRYVWRPTFVYFKILKYLRKADYMASYDTYHSKLYELIAKAYQKGKIEDYQHILAYEMKQLLEGDIPLFDLNSLSHHLGNDQSIKTFEYNCVENINNRICLLSATHKAEQIGYINNWLRIAPLL